MRFILLTICFAFMANLSLAQEQTELEKFSAKTGVVQIMGYTTIGKVLAGTRSYADYISFQTRILSTPDKAFEARGVLITIVDSDGYQGRSFIDEDEIDDLIAGIEYISKATKEVTTLNSFEVSYSTLGDFKLTVYNKSSGELGLSVEGGGREVRPKFESIPEIIAKIKEARP